MSNIRQTAIRLNQDGAEAFSQGNLTVALLSFRNALQTMVSRPPAPGSPSDDTGAGLSSTQMHSQAAMGITHMMLSKPRDDMRGEEAEPFIFKRPLVLDPAFLPDSQDGVAAFCAAVVFNMAVVFHQKSLKDDSSFQTQTLQLYESSIELFSKISPRFDLSGAICASLNNKACLHYARGDFEDSIVELKRLQRYIVPAEHSLSTPAILETEDFQGILLNVLLLRPPTLARAA